MLINLETKFSVGDMVFFIREEDKYNDWYSTETYWRVKSKDSDFYDEKEKPLMIKEIIITQGKTQANIAYNVDNCIVSEKYIFTDYVTARNECDKRNGEVA